MELGGWVRMRGGTPTSFMKLKTSQHHLKTSHPSHPESLDFVILEQLWGHEIHGTMSLFVCAHHLKSCAQLTLQSLPFLPSRLQGSPSRIHTQFLGLIFPPARGACVHSLPPLHSGSQPWARAGHMAPCGDAPTAPANRDRPIQPSATWFGTNLDTPNHLEIHRVEHITVPQKVAVDP